VPSVLESERLVVTSRTVGIKKGSLEHAIEIASVAHRGQVDKANEPYILHPMRVMEQVDSRDEKIIAILHDVVEKNPQWSLNRLASEGFKPKIVEAVDAMTRRTGESYEDFVLRAAANPASSAVKLADLKDNIHMSRIAGLDDSKYRRAIELVAKRHSPAKSPRIARS
jgi:(p)ppGpp synthase/HD superfamily hydrolase